MARNNIKTKVMCSSSKKNKASSSPKGLLLAGALLCGAAEGLVPNTPAPSGTVQMETAANGDVTPRELDAAPAKKPLPQTNSFKTLISIEQKGGWDAASGFVNIGGRNLDLYCGKRKNLGTRSQCECAATSGSGACTEYKAKATGLYPLSDTDDLLAMTDLLAGKGPNDEDGWLKLYNEGHMSIVPGVARRDHNRSHFKAGEAASKGVSAKEEATTKHGYMARAISNLRAGYSFPAEGADIIDGISMGNSGSGINPLRAEAGIKFDQFFHLNGVNDIKALLQQKHFDYHKYLKLSRADDHQDEHIEQEFAEAKEAAAQAAAEAAANNGTMADGMMDDGMMARILQEASAEEAAGDAADPADETTDETDDAVGDDDELDVDATYAEASGIENEDTMYDEDRMDGDHSEELDGDDLDELDDEPEASSVSSGSRRKLGRLGSSRARRLDHTVFNQSMGGVAVSTTLKVLHDNAGMSDLLDKEARLHKGLESVESRLKEYESNTRTLCPGFPGERVFSPRTSNRGSIGYQLRNVALLMVNGVRPRVFQLQQGGYDTHQNQESKLKSIILDLRVGIAVFIRTAKQCGFFSDTLIGTYSEFGRRFAENSHRGTDHGNGSVFTLFGEGLTQRVLGYNKQKDSSALADIIPNPQDSFNKPRVTFGDLPRTTALVTYQACLLQAMGLPELQRHGDEADETGTSASCPAAMAFRENLARIPAVDQALLAPSQVTAAISASGDASELGPHIVLPRAHLNVPLTKADVLSVAHRIGYSAKSLDLQGKFLDPAIETDLGAAHNDTATLTKINDLALDASNPARTAVMERRPYHDLVHRQRHPFYVHKLEEREHGNQYKRLMSLVYPKKDGVPERILRWGLTDFFTVSGNSVKIAAAKIEETSSDLGVTAKEAEKLVGKQIFALIQENATFLKPRDHRNWYNTILYAQDVRLLTTITADDILDEYSCGVDGKHPKYPEESCDVTCDLRSHLEYNADTQRVEFKDKNYRRDGSHRKASWYVVHKCTEPHHTRHRLESSRYHHYNRSVRDDVLSIYFNHLKDPAMGLRMRLTFFFLNWYATPASSVHDWVLIYKQYFTIFTHALGSFRELSHAMFYDEAVRRPLNQPVDAMSCEEKPIENFGRELLERYSVGLGNHNYEDIKILSKALQKCPKVIREEGCSKPLPDDAPKGLIFKDPNEKLVIDNAEDEKTIVNRILNFRRTVTSAPAAALTVCRRLFHEFATAKPSGDSIRVCAHQLADNDYHMEYAMKAVLEDPVFYEKLGTQQRWPLAVIVGAVQEFNLSNEHTKWRKMSTGTFNHIAHHVGMPLFEVPDVAGFVKETIWSTNRLSNAHNYLYRYIRYEQHRLITTNDFANEAKFEAKMEPYKVVINVKETGADESGTHVTRIIPKTFYTVAEKMCSGRFVDFKNQIGFPLVSVAELFKKSSSWARHMEWRKTQDHILGNLCEFVA